MHEFKLVEAGKQIVLQHVNITLALNMAFRNSFAEG